MTSVNKRILLVEDDRFLRRACEASLRQRGYEVIAASDGEEGLRLARTDPPDLILLDLLMPKMPGIDMLRALRADDRLRFVPVLILSNSSREEDRAQSRALGARGYFVKANLSLLELAAQVAAVLESEAENVRE